MSRNPTGEFKQMVLEDMQKNKLYKETALNKMKVCGPLGELAIILGLGRPKKLSSQVEEDLIAEVQRLRTENAYLKKLNALIQVQER